MSNPETLDDVRRQVLDNGNIITIGMERLRNAHGAERLGELVRANISRKLSSLGLSHFPIELPGSQADVVRLYMQGSPVANLIDAVLNPSPAHDEEIREAVQGNNSDTLDKIRELVCR